MTPRGCGKVEGMTVAELIEQLKEMPQEAIPQVFDGCLSEWVAVTEIEDPEDGTVSIV